LLENKKISGILIESEMQQENLELTIGIGINYSIPKKESWWGDLGNLRDILPREQLINTILKKIIAFKEHSYSDWQQAWENRCMHQNLEINIQTNSGAQIAGIFRGVDNEGKMLLETINGTQAISSGECSITGLY
jgi:BirA family biotin operon repressor/biotin-[acetyl-CoA-carboxylase] ligase